MHFTGWNFRRRDTGGVEAMIRNTPQFIAMFVFASLLSHALLMASDVQGAESLDDSFPGFGCPGDTLLLRIDGIRRHSDNTHPLSSGSTRSPESLPASVSKLTYRLSRNMSPALAGG